MCLKLMKYMIVLFGIAWISDVQCNDKDYNDCSFIYWKMDWKSAVSTCEADNKQLLCYKSKKEMDDITEAFRLAAFGNAELELWLSGKNCSEPQIMDECLILHIKKKDLTLWHYFLQDCTKKYPFVCCVKDNERPISSTSLTSTTSVSTITSAEIIAGNTTSTAKTTTTTITIPSTTIKPDICKKVNRRGIEWPDTPSDEVATVPCPGNSAGKARWLCRGNLKVGWDEHGPNLRDCRSLDVMNLKEKFNTSSIQDAMTLLERVFSDHEQEIFGEDLADVIAMMTSLPDRFLTATQFQSSSDRWTSTKNLVEKSASLFDRIIELDETWHDITEKRRPIAGTHLLSTIDEMGLILADAMDENIKEQSVIGKNMALQVLKTKYGESLQLPQWDVTSSYSHRGNVKLEEGYDGHLRPEEGNISVIFTLYSDLTSIFAANEAQNESDSSGVLNSAIVSATVSQNRKPRPISRPVRILMEHLLPKPNDTACVFWNMQRNEWDTEGCRVESGNDTYSVCSCDHLTNFALLMDYQGLLDDVDQIPFHYITLVGCILSIISLSICVVVFSCYSYHSKHAWGLRYVIHRNLCVALLVANLLLVLGLDRTDSPKLCSIIAGLLHYFFLSSFSWMLLEGVHIYLLLVVVFASRRSHSEKYYLFGYGFPLIIVIITAIIRPKYYGTDRVCWLSQEKGTIWAFMGPVACILLLNVAALVLAQYKASKISVKDDNIALFKRWLRVTLILFPVLGITWIFGFMYIGKRAIVVGYIFAILNSLQKARNMVVSSFKKKSASVTTGSSGSHKKNNSSNNNASRNTSTEKKSLPATFQEACRRNWNKLHKPWSFCFDMPVSERGSQDVQKEHGEIPPKPLIVQWNSLPA
ncbi:unnamed protein product [Larinioides sclopetarius]|uniref:Uncharacterized protein n=1 Tax=Larinioides sclopetarius TaxID=280406 RepID=A0AAV1ZQI0_9ARAC